MNIKEKIEEHIDYVVNNGGAGTTRGNEIAEAGLKALFAGIGRFDHNGVVTEVTPEWEEFMTHFSNNQAELDRLCGKEEAFNKSGWGLHCLAYIVGDSNCTAETTFKGGAKRTMELLPDRRMLENLDAEGDDLNDF